MFFYNPFSGVFQELQVVCVCWFNCSVIVFVGLSVSLPESAHIGLGELLSSVTFAHERTGLPAH